MVEVLLAGESWFVLTFEVKGRDTFAQGSYGEGAEYLLAALESVGATIDFQPCHVAATEFPRTLDALDAYDLVILSDVGADTLQITPQVADSERDVDRCALLEEYVSRGGALGMIGGYMSFAGKGGRARYASTAVADALPVDLLRGDDRVEAPAGAVPRNSGVPDDALPDEFPPVLGYNKLEANDDAAVWATVDGDPFLVVGDHGEGSTFALATDCAPHWAPPDFLEWEGLPRLWAAILERVTGRSVSA